MALQASPEPAAGLQNREVWLPAIEIDPEAICKQLERLLISSVFRNSKRCSDLLTYLVHRALDDVEAGRLKERTIGIEVFGRVPDYDTTADHVVRSMAGEVRKRLAQYYMEPGHATEIRIDVPSGSYAARFQLPSVKQFQELGGASVSVSEKIDLPQAGTRRERPRLVTALTVFAAAAVLVALGIGTQFPEPSGGTLDRFWRPVLSPPNPILLCIGNWDRPHGSSQAETHQADNTDTSQSMTLRDFHSLESQKVFLNDAITLAKIAGLLQQKGQRFRVMSHSTVTFADLQNGPAVLIGLRSNYWTSSLISQLRFSVERGTAPHTLIIKDKKNPSRRDWYIDTSTPYQQTTKDYALVVRVLDSKTGQMVVTAAGLTSYGTLAAGEFLTNPAQLKKLEAYAPRAWENKDLAIVLSTEVIKASVGSPNVVAAEFW